MAEFEELLSKLRNPGDDGPGETIYDDLNAAYNNRVSAGDAKVAELSNAQAELDAKNQRLMAHNYELLTAIERGNGPAVTQGVSQEEDKKGDEVVTSLADIITYS